MNEDCAVTYVSKVIKEITSKDWDLIVREEIVEKAWTLV
jgi:hypothetical protein